MPRRRCRVGENSRLESPEMQPGEAGLAEWASIIYTFPLFIEIF